MTQKLFYDSGLSEYEATVLRCRETENGCEVLLDRTVIFPEGGGQLSDTGYIDDAKVTYAFEDGEDIWHRTDRPIQQGKTVRVRFDRMQRTDHSQQHSGEHMLSGLAYSMFGCVNVGFHMAEDYVSVDFDKQLDDDQVKALESAVNEAIQKNAPTTYITVDAQGLETVDIRKKAKGLSGEIRIVYVGGVDSCTCCGTHCAYAGEIGLLKINAHANYKGGTRIWFVCGMRAVRAMAEDAELIEAVARRFSTKKELALAALVKQGDELAQTRRTLKKRTEELFGYLAAGLFEKARKAGDTAVVVANEEELGMTELAMLCDGITKKGSAIALIFSQGGEQLYYRMTTNVPETLSMKELCAAVNAITGGKGGGRDDGAQGSASARGDVGEICVQIENYLINRLKAGKLS